LFTTAVCDDYNNKVKKNISENIKIPSRLKSDFLSISYLALSGLFSLSLFSYNPKDLSFHSKVYNWSEPTHNFCGYLGSFLSDLLYQFLGLGAWAAPLILFWFFWSRMTGKKTNIEKVLFFGVGVFSFCLSMGFFKEFYLFDGLIFAGGAFGKNVFSALYPLVSKGGLFIIITISFALTTLVFLEKTLSDIHFRSFSFSKFKEKFRLSKLSSGKEQGLKNLTEEESAGVSVAPISILKSVLPLKEEKFEKEEPLSLSMPQVKRPQKVKEVKVPKEQLYDEEAEWELPELDLMGDTPEDNGSDLNDEEIQEKAKLLVTKLEQFNVKGQITGIKTGPAVTLFEFKPNVNVKISKITELADDLSLALSSKSVRIIAPIPGRDVVGIETSNSSQGTVYLKDILSTDDFWDEEYKIPLALGKKASQGGRNNTHIQLRAKT